MSTNKKPIFFNSVSSKCVEIDNADGTATQTMFSATADGGGVTNLSATSTDTVSVVVVLSVNDGTQINVIGEVSVPAGAGTNGTTPAKDLLDGVRMPGSFQNDGSLGLGPNAILLVNAKAAVTATKVVSVTAFGGNYADA